MSTRIVVYPGSFNPITLGHANIVERALDLFDKVVVAIGKSADKNSDSLVQQRIELCRYALAEFGEQVSVQSFDGLLVDFVKQQKTKFILRGLRTLTDYDYEYQMLEMNRHIDSNIEYVLLPTASQWSFLSSTRVREIAALGGDISAFVHPTVAEYLQRTSK